MLTCSVIVMVHNTRLVLLSFTSMSFGRPWVRLKCVVLQELLMRLGGETDQAIT